YRVTLRAGFPLLLGVVAAGSPQRALAAPPDAHFDVTDAASVLYNFDNRDTRRGQVGTVANDHFGLLYNRLNLQVTSGKLTLMLRADSAWFYASRSPEEIADELASLESPSVAGTDYRLRKLTEAGIELSNRFINWTYPAKYAVTWGSPDFEVTLGDSYAQLGRGLVLSLRKLDELASDNTVRGARIAARFKTGDLRMKLTALGGSLNPLRLDEASGRYLGVQSNVTPGFVALTEAGMPRAIGTAFTPLAGGCEQSGTCSFAPDRLLAAQVELAFPKATLSTQGSLVAREPALTQDTSRSASSILTVSQSLELPSFAQHGSAYFEGAFQRLDGAASAPDAGYALYGSVSWIEPRFSLVAEGKHYRRFFPLSANVSASRAREFALLAYSAPPTTEEIWNDTQFGGLNTCVSGGRLKAEVHATRAYSVFTWLGHYRSFGESVSNDACDTRSENENRIWDAAAGVNANLRTRPARYQIWMGTRFDDTTRTLSSPNGATEVFYRELYLRYSVSEPLGGPFTLELQGFHRRRRETVGGPSDRWFEGQHSTAIDWGERLSAAIGVEYDSRPGVPLGYVNAMLSYRPTSAWSFALFAGQRRGALRCVGGVCRVYPAFEGVRLDATFRYGAFSAATMSRSRDSLEPVV
ncbi:MAG TPA: hypothetical protein VFQ35_11675, partial [Polyangiaceae bacterium]|nr:hypothetical protein [Polyangiaceae bacterium]